MAFCGLADSEANTARSHSGQHMWRVAPRMAGFGSGHRSATAAGAARIAANYPEPPRACNSVQATSRTTKITTAVMIQPVRLRCTPRVYDSLRGLDL